MYGWEFPPHSSGGLGVACYGLTRELVREGVDVRFVLPRRYPVSVSGAKMVFADESHPLTGTQAQQFASGYITEDRLQFLRGQYPELQYGPSLFDEVLRYAAFSPLVALQQQPDVIHSHDWLCLPAGMAAKRATGAPLVVHVHATEFDRTGRGTVNQNIYNIERRGMHEADKILAVSEYTKNIIVEHYGVSPDKIEVVYNGIDPDSDMVLSPQEVVVHRLKEAGWDIVLFHGRLTIQKGPDYFLRAAKKVLEHRPNVAFVVSGSGDMAQQMIDQAAYYGIGDKVFFVGWTKGKVAATLYKLSDLFVMPSVSEPFGLVPLEALMNGTPVIISKQAGVSEVLRNALKVDFWDVDDMAHKILSVLEHPELAKTLASEGNREARGQVWNRVARRCMMVYKNVTKKLLRV